MKWFHSREQNELQQYRNQFASSYEIEEAFADHGGYLYWIALLITGDAESASRSIVNATELCSKNSGVFRDWLGRWARSATVRIAIAEVREQITKAASRYEFAPYGDSYQKLLSEDEIAALRLLDPQEIIASLGPLARCILVLRGVQHASISNCALFLELPRRVVTSAYCEAGRWAAAQTKAAQIC